MANEENYRYPLPIEQTKMEEFANLAQRLALRNNQTIRGSVGQELQQAIDNHLRTMKIQLTHDHYQKLNGGVKKI